MEVIEPQNSFIDQSMQAREVTILCSTCGCSFPPGTTGTNVCLKCISTQTDVTSGITKQAVLNFCRTCKRYLRPPWVHAELESKELLALCLRRVRGLNKVKLLDASFIWTEPHSRRVKVKLTVQKEVLNNVTVQQTFPIEFVVFYQQCDDCKKDYTPHTWGAACQVRQKVDHKKTFLYLEQLILKYNAHDKVLKIKDLPEGVDFYYKDRSHAQRLVDFLQTMFSVRVKHSKQLISQDLSSNTCSYKYTFSVDLPRVCKDDLVILPPKVTSALGGCSSVLICTKVATMITFMDPVTMRTIEICGNEYFKYEDDLSFIPCKGFATEFLVFDIEPCEAPKSGSIHIKKVKSARATVGRISDWQNFDVKTYLGDVLKEGSYVWGYDLSSLNLSGFIDNHSSLKELPDVILVKKSYQEAKNLKRRIWRLKELEKEKADTKAMNRDNEKRAKDYEEFLNDLETDPEMRSHVNMYRNEKAIKEKEKNKMIDEAEEGEGVEETTGKKKKGGLKKKLKVKRKGKKTAQTAPGAATAEGKDNEDDKKKDENKDAEVEKEEEDEKNDDDDPLVRVEELLADLTLEDQVVENNDDAIDEFISRLEKVRIEGKE